MKESMRIPGKYQLTWLGIWLAASMARAAAGTNDYARWSNGPSASSDYFPIAVWLQQPANAARYKDAGINLYIGLWEGPTQEQLDALSRAGMPVICYQNEVGLRNRNNPIIVGWMQVDEPDNAQWAGHYGPPVSTGKVKRHYDDLRSADSSRPVLLNLGQGVANDNYIGRGVRRSHLEDYPEYVKGCDIASFDIYPVVSPYPEIAGRLECVAKGVERLVRWQGGKPVWNCIEASHVENAERKATPAQVRAEVWMSLIHGSRGLIYFVHQFKPVFREASLLEDPEMLAAVTAINHRIRELAPLLNSPTITNGVIVHSSSAVVPMAAMVKQDAAATYLFAVAMGNGATRGEFGIGNLSAGTTAEVLDESRRIPVIKGGFADDFKPYEVHLYRIQQVK